MQSGQPEGVQRRSWQGFHWRDETGSSADGFEPELTWRPDVVPHAERRRAGSNTTDEDSQWVENVSSVESATHYVFGRIDQTTVGLTARVNYTITPNLTVQLYARAVRVGRRLLAVPGTARRRAPRRTRAQFSPYPYTGNPDFNYKSFRTTNVLRWEYKPGSALYLVWQQGSEDVGK